MIEVVPDGPVDPQALEEFEATLPAPLPAAYRSSLLRTGGGEAAQDYSVANGVLSEFLPLGGDLGYDLVSYRRSTSGFGAWVPEDFLIIAPGSGGSLCLRLTGPEAGSIWWADYDAGDELTATLGDAHADPLPQMMRRLSDDLPSFLRDYPLSDGEDRTRGSNPPRSS